MQTKTCTHCKQVKPASEFYAHKRNADGLQSYCKECGRVATADTRARRKAPPTASANPDFQGITDRELQENARAILNELRARGWQIECEIAYLHKKKL